MSRTLAAVFALLLAGTVTAAEVSVSHAWIRVLPGDLPLAAYCDLHNNASRALTLTGAESPAFEAVGLHRSVDEEGLARMVPVRALPIAPGETVHLAPGGYHLMLFTRKRDLAEGDTVAITLRFADGHTESAKFQVRGADSP